MSFGIFTIKMVHGCNFGVSSLRSLMVSVDVKHHVYFIFHFGVNVQGISFRSGASSVPSVSVTSYSLLFSICAWLWSPTQSYTTKTATQCCSVGCACQKPSQCGEAYNYIAGSAGVWRRCMGFSCGFPAPIDRKWSSFSFHMTRLIQICWTPAMVG